MRTARSLILSGVAAMALAGATSAAELKQIGAMKVPGEAINNFDVSFVDEATGRYYLADRTNTGVDVFDTANDAFVARVPGFIGVVVKSGKPSNAVSGPDGVLVADGQIWVGDGNSTVTVVDAATLKTVATVNTGGKTRLDEMAFDPKDHIFIGVNNAEEPPFATLISTQGERQVLGRIVFESATDGAEQPAYNPLDGLFYMSIPELDKDTRKGAVAVIDPRTAKLVKMLPVTDCHPAGLAFGPNGNFVLGCSADGKEMPAITVVMNAASGKVVATIPDLGAADMVNYNARNNHYYTASRANPGGPVLGVIDASTNTLVQKVAITGGYPHSVASSESNGHVYVPVGTVSGGDGTVHVYAPAP